MNSIMGDSGKLGIRTNSAGYTFGFYHTGPNSEGLAAYYSMPTQTTNNEKAKQHAPNMKPKQYHQ